MAYLFHDIRGLDLDLARLSTREAEDLRIRIERAAARGVKAFDAFAHSATETHPPIAAHVSHSKRENKLILAVSGRAPTFRLVKVDPGLSTPTTGRNRQKVTVSGWSSRSVSIPRGFVWNGTVMQRLEGYGRDFTSARRYAAAHGALPSPAQILARCQSEVIGAVMEELYGKRD